MIAKRLTIASGPMCTGRQRPGSNGASGDEARSVSSELGRDPHGLLAPPHRRLEEQDRRDWQIFADCFTDHVHVNFSGSGVPEADFARDDLVDLVRVPLSGFTATQHISPNHVIEFDEDDSDRAICYSDMYAQHYLEGSEGDDFFLLRGSYTNHMLRISDGWRIESLTQHVGWSDRNQDALTEATARSQIE